MSASTISNGTEDFDLWLYRLGHSTYSTIGLPNHTPKATKRPCLVCPPAKLQKIQFSLSQHISKKCFDFIHCDIWGPCNETSYDGFRYFLTIADNFGICTWVCVLKLRYDASTGLQGFCS